VNRFERKIGSLVPEAPWRLIIKNKQEKREVLDQLPWTFSISDGGFRIKEGIH
jgi:hypothetical protein